jgi:hypothetical protein
MNCELTGARQKLLGAVQRVYTPAALVPLNRHEEMGKAKVGHAAMKIPAMRNYSAWLTADTSLQPMAINTCCFVWLASPCASSKRLADSPLTR